MTDPINPEHYFGKKWEVIDIIEAYGLDHFRATALAYILRAERKNREEDIRKAVWYLRRLAGSSLNLANSIGVIADPRDLAAMPACEICADFEILDDELRDAVACIVPDPKAFCSSLTVKEDAIKAADLCETWLRRSIAARLDAEAGKRDDASTLRIIPRRQEECPGNG